MSALIGEKYLSQIDLRVAPGAARTGPSAADGVVAAMPKRRGGRRRPPVSSGAEVRQRRGRSGRRRHRRAVRRGRHVRRDRRGRGRAGRHLDLPDRVRPADAAARPAAHGRRRPGPADPGAGRRGRAHRAGRRGGRGARARSALGHLLPVLAKAFGAQIASPGPAAGWPPSAWSRWPSVITVLAVLAPAVSAARVAPLEALRSSSTTGGAPGHRRGCAGRSACCWSLGAAAVAALRDPPACRGRDPEDYDPAPMLLGVVASGGAGLLRADRARPGAGPAGAGRGRLAAPPARPGRPARGRRGRGAPRRAAAVSVVVALGVTLIAGVLVGRRLGCGCSPTGRWRSSVPADFELTAGRRRPDAGADLVEQARGRPGADRTSRRTGGSRRDGRRRRRPSWTPPTWPMTALPATGQAGRRGRVAGATSAPAGSSLSGSPPTSPGCGSATRHALTAGERTVELTVAALLPGSAPLGSGWCSTRPT